MSPAKISSQSSNDHPLDPLTADELLATTNAIRSWCQQNQVKAVRFLNVLADEPHKSQVIAAGFFPLGDGADEHKSATQGAIARKVIVHFSDEVTGRAFDARVDASDLDAVTVTDVKQLEQGVQPALTAEELVMCEEAIRKDQRVVEAAAEVGVTPEQLFGDGWSIGWDERFPGRRVQQCICYARYGKDENLYAHPLDFMPIIDNLTGEVLAIDYPDHRVKNGRLTTKSTAPTTDASFEKPSTRQRITPPQAKHDYLPELATRIGSDKPIEMRTDIKPLSVVQPEGVSFKRTGNVLEWGKFKLHVGFHPREGLVLSNVVYRDDEIPGYSKAQPKERPLFYRMSISEMVVPYAEPAHPHYRKFAFDVGEYGLGFLANSLSLGCDCLGSIEYMDGHIAKHDGSVQTIKNAICIHEEDAGLLWKHTDYRPGGRAHAVRNRKLIISMVCTVANYEYQFNWTFSLDGNIELEIKLTGILNLYMLAEGEKPAGYGTEVAPRINAHYHQHLFSVRLDSHIDGQNNSVSEQHIECSDAPTHSAENWAGNAFTAPNRILKTTAEGVRDADANIERSWTLVNENVRHYASGKPVGYKILCKDMPRLNTRHDGICAVRAPFAKHHLWTLPYHATERYPSGMFVPQTFEAPQDSIEKWVGDGKTNVANADIVTYVTVGTTHIPRPEDFPVMPTEKVSMVLKPVHFFYRNPTLDVPATNDAKSVSANASNGVACCH